MRKTPVVVSAADTRERTDGSSHPTGHRAEEVDGELAVHHQATVHVAAVKIQPRHV
ncbi:hypothetical protein [Umezawaea beigongshangensis]|uniref:hypothetical protein n=1 Tax=Umezawaea beigongshangensis TaxID=2780383 RepID=UPI0018F19709|nr:hypothetical protein [Umezawaea beigongshangensis]